MVRYVGPRRTDTARTGHDVQTDQDMPVCFQLCRKAAPAMGPVPLETIDVELCAFLNVPVDKVKWCHGWYDHIGFNLACGKSYAEIKATYEQYVKVGGDEFDRTMVRIVDWFEANFVPSAFHQRSEPKLPEIKRAPEPAPEPERSKSPAELHRIANSLLRGHDHNGRATSGQHPRHWGRR